MILTLIACYQIQFSGWHNFLRVRQVVESCTLVEIRRIDDFNVN